MLYIKVREDHRVVSKSCHIAIGITEQGDREIIGLMQNGESESSWIKFFEYLKERGLNGTELVISDAHKGLVSAIRKAFTGASWQRCEVHFMRNILQVVPKKDSKQFREQLKAIFLQISNLLEQLKINLSVHLLIKSDMKKHVRF